VARVVILMSASRIPLLIRRLLYPWLVAPCGVLGERVAGTRESPDREAKLPEQKARASER